MSEHPRLTICTVSFKHESLIRLNLDLMESLNPSLASQARWIIADNAIDSTENGLAITHPAIEIRAGSRDTSAGASQHHALALNTLVETVDTRYLLVLDPDFYLLQPDWINRVIGHMQQRGLAFFGAPWHPRYNRNYRYFPAVHCMFVDLDVIPRETLDFQPRLDLVDAPVKRAGPLDLIGVFARRKRIPWDTGVRVFEQFGGHNDIASECVKPVYREGLNNAGSLSTRLLERILPDTYCYFPKRRDSYLRTGFHEAGLAPAPLPNLWEETYWQDQPFGLHVRRSYGATSRDDERERSLLTETLATLTAKCRRGGHE